MKCKNSILREPDGMALRAADGPTKICRSPVVNSVRGMVSCGKGSRTEQAAVEANALGFRK